MMPAALGERRMEDGMGKAYDKYHQALVVAGEQRTHALLVYRIALSAAETITGMIVATTLVYPDKMLSSVKAKSVRKRMGAKEFARAVNRDRIHLCEKINIPLDEFISISIEAMRRISNRLGL